MIDLQKVQLYISPFHDQCTAIVQPYVSFESWASLSSSSTRGAFGAIDDGRGVGKVEHLLIKADRF